MNQPPHVQNHGHPGCASPGCDRSNRPRIQQLRLLIRKSQNQITRPLLRSCLRKRCQSSSSTRHISCQCLECSLDRRTHNDLNSPALIRSTDAMKCLLDAMLVITKQDRLCHVIHATSDPFYQTWLRQLNVMQHCKVSPSTHCCRHFVDATHSDSDYRRLHQT